jgi:hypothetical protein
MLIFVMKFKKRWTRPPRWCWLNALRTLGSKTDCTIVYTMKKIYKSTNPGGVTVPPEKIIGTDFGIKSYSFK